ncbi:ERCC4 [Cordylochernes scorpioides]|uniref:ERCC4 n=1 Tax=Cordylochernes scorpioides TaxID=51811 RepID=A0ABY6L1V0_9ARAC|nr:ERCC4 [Cordylochernes scorpioides]
MKRPCDPPSVEKGIEGGRYEETMWPNLNKRKRKYALSHTLPQAIHTRPGLFKVMKMNPDMNRSNRNCNNCHNTQLTPDHIYPAILAALYMADINPEVDIHMAPQLAGIVHVGRYCDQGAWTNLICSMDKTPPPPQLAVGRYCDQGAWTNLICSMNKTPPPQLAGIVIRVHGPIWSAPWTRHHHHLRCMDLSDLLHGQDTTTTSVGRYCDQGAWTDLICSMDKTPPPPQLAGCMDRSDLLHGQDTTTTSVGRYCDQGAWTDLICSMDKTPPPPQCGTTKMNLEFEREMFLDLHNEDSLLIMSKGLGMRNLLVSLITVYCDPRTLVLVMGATKEEQTAIIDQLTSQNVYPPKVGSECSTKDRTEQYFQGGVIFVTPRVLVVDLLLERVPLDLVAGVILYRAHKVNESCQEAFILRLYRQKNKKGFLNAISDSPLSFTKGYCHLDRMMRLLFVTKLHLWPRIHATVISSLDSRIKPHVIEMQIKLSRCMKEIQLSLLELLTFCVQELKKMNSQIEMENVTVENLIGPEFNSIFKFHLDPMWHQFSARSRRFLGDLKTLKTLLKLMMQQDCVSFYNMIKTMNILSKIFLISSPQAQMPSTGENMVLERRGVFLDPPQLQGQEVPIYPHLCRCKHGQSVVLQAMPEDPDLKYLTEGYFATLTAELNEVEGADFIAPEEVRTPDKSLDQIFFLNKNDHSLQLEQMLLEHQIKTIVLYDPNLELVRRIEVHQAKHPEVQLQVYFLCYTDSVEEQHYLASIRRSGRPSNISSRRRRDGRLDIHPDLSVNLTPANETVNPRKAGLQSAPPVEQRVIVDTREFRSQLPSLIHRRGIAIEPVTLEVGDYVLSPDSCVERKSVPDLIGSLNSGRLFTQAQSMLRHYSRALLLIEFDPSKSFSFQLRRSYIYRDKHDLSLFSLLQESVGGAGEVWSPGGVTYIEINMTSHCFLYYKSQLVVQGKYGAQAERVTTKVVLLILHFPRLHLIWSPSPHFSAEIFERLKANRPQPDSQKALTVSVSQSEKYNPVLKDMLLKLPGVNSRNQWALLSKVSSFSQLVQLSEAKLADILDNKAAAASLWAGLHYSRTSRPPQAKKRKK